MAVLLSNIEIGESSGGAFFGKIRTVDFKQLRVLVKSGVRKAKAVVTFLVHLFKSSFYWTKYIHRIVSLLKKVGKK